MSKISTCIFNDHGRCCSCRKNPDCDIPPSLYRCARCNKYSNMKVSHNNALLRAVNIERDRLTAYSLALIGEIAELVQ